MTTPLLDTLAAEHTKIITLFKRRDVGGARNALRDLQHSLEVAPEELWVAKKFLHLTYLAAIATGDASFAERVCKAVLPEDCYAYPLAVSPLSTLGDWCKTHHVGYFEVEAAQKVIIESAARYSMPHEYKTDPVFYATLSEARWIGGWDYVLAADGTVLHDTSYQPVGIAMRPYPHFYQAQFGRILHYAPRREENHEGDVVYLSGPYGHHFGHWMIDFLPRLRALDFLDGVTAKIAVPEDISVKQLDMLRLWGLNQNDLLLCRRDTRYRFKRLHVLQTGRSMPSNPTHVRYVRDHVYSPRDRAASIRGKRVFASRSNVGTRDISNWPEVRQILDDARFTIVDMADLSIADQQNLLADAEILMGVYGSNLFALYFAPPTCAVITLMPVGYDDPTIDHSCQFIGMRHQYLECAVVGRGAKTQKKDTDIVVDCNTLRARLLELVHKA